MFTQFLKMAEPYPKNHQIDVYSYGIICYEMLIRKCPFKDHLIIVVLDGNQPKAFGYVDN